MKSQSVALLPLLAVLTLATASHSMESSPTQAKHRAKVSNTKKQKKEAVMYQCPMKDSPPQNKPGNCPVCGMALEKVSPK